jgi:signal transduction histidine kinase
MPLAPPSQRTLLAVAPALVASGVVTWFTLRLSHQGRDTSTEAYTDLWRPYRWVCVVFAVGAITYGAVRLLTGDLTGGVFAAYALTVLSFSVPWTLFALNYVGRSSLITPRRIRLACVYVAVVNVSAVLGVDRVQSSLGPYPDLAILSSLLSLGVLLFVISACCLVLLSTYRHQTLGVSHGAVAVFPVLAFIIIIQLTRESVPLFSEVAMSVGWVATAAALVLAPDRYDLLAMRPGTGTVGERAAVREMDEAIVAVERDGTLARANDTARGLFGDRLDGDSFADLVGCELPELGDRETVECWTADGRKQFDPRVTVLVNDYDEVYGYTVTLIDITDREIRRQRIEVLNRILRHNIRNNLDVIKADAEVVTDEERAESILDTTDTLERLSADARRIESLLRRSQGERSTADLATVVTTVADNLAEDHPEATISVDLGALSAKIDAELCRFALRNIVENAIIHNDGDDPRVEVRGKETDNGARLIVADNGPGIPESERSVIERQAESPQEHASSLGLWGTNWAVQQLGGELSFRQSDLGGTAVVIELPTR